jgi:hypothetical protein
MMSGLPAVHTTVTHAPGRDGTILLLEAPTVTVIIARGLPPAVMTGEAPVDVRGQVEAGGEMAIRDPAAEVMRIVLFEVDRPTVATIMLVMTLAGAASIEMRAAVIHVGVAVEEAVIPDDLEDMTIARCGVRRPQLAIGHLRVAVAVSGGTASAPAPAPTDHAPAMESPPICRQAPGWVGARVSTLSGPIVYASRE